MPAATQLQHRAAEQAVPEGIGLPPGASTFILPLGFVDHAERRHGEAELSPLTGREQRLLASFSASTPVARITTELLCRAVKRLGSLAAVDRDVVRGLLPGDREFLLLKLYQITFGDTLLAALRCPAEGCGEPLEFPVSIQDCGIEAAPVNARVWPLRTAEEAGSIIRFRLPTGADQELLAAEPESDPETLQERLLAACCAEPDGSVVGKLSREERARIEDQMNRLAPQVEVEVEAACPECGSGFSTRLDMPYLALMEMKMTEAELDWEVHYLAWHYHWPESEILSLTPGRRRRYINLVRREVEEAGEI